MRAEVATQAQGDGLTFEASLLVKVGCIDLAAATTGAKLVTSYCGFVRTLHPAYRVTELGASLHFYQALGYARIGRVDLEDGATLTMLKLPHDEVVTLELVHRPADGRVDVGSGFSHLAVQVDSLEATRDLLLDAGLKPGDIQRPGGPSGPQTLWLADPDGYRIELVQWPPGHAYGMTAADFEPRADR